MIVDSAPPRPSRKQLALTFDDGPSPWTPAILDVFREHGARGTFFVLGERVDGAEDVLQRAVREGSELGNHTFTHPHCSELAPDALAEELARTQARIGEAVGIAPRLVRPPYGDGPEAVDAAGAAFGLTTVLWSIDPVDWSEPPAEAIAQHVLERAEPGAIVDLHDGFPSHASAHHTTRAATVDAIRLLVPALVADGYELVTVSELLAP